MNVKASLDFALLEDFDYLYRYETAPNPVPELRDRTQDNTQLGRLPQKVLQHA